MAIHALLLEESALLVWELIEGLVPRRIIQELRQKARLEEDRSPTLRRKIILVRLDFGWIWMRFCFNLFVRVEFLFWYWKYTLALANLPPSGPSGIPTIQRHASSASAYGGRIRKYSNMSNVEDEPGKCFRKSVKAKIINFNPLTSNPIVTRTTAINYSHVSHSKIFNN